MKMRKDEIRIESQEVKREERRKKVKREERKKR